MGGMKNMPRVLPLFWPALRGYRSQAADAETQTSARGMRRGFSWALYRRNREYQALVGFFRSDGCFWESSCACED